MVSADGADHVQVLRAAYAGHLGAERLGDLHCECTQASRRPVDQHLLAWLHLALIAKNLKGGRGGNPNGRSLLEREVGWLQYEMVLGGTRILGKGASAPADYLIAWSELRHILADRLN